MSVQASDPKELYAVASDTDEGFDIAIIGMAGRFPGARNLDEYWQNLANGVESITRLSDEELAEAGIDPRTLADPAYVKAAPILDGIELFDAPLFGYSPREAAILDPQHRLFLTVAWEALEAAGYNGETDGAGTGVFAGASLPHYLISNLLAGRRLQASGSAFEALIGNDKDYLATRTSFKLNLRGPSITVQTACSTSLVAVHLACQSLLGFQCDMALAGGVALRVPQAMGYFCQDDMIFSPDGHCRTFDARGRGTIFGSGVGVVVLKRLEDALADGDLIEAVIKGSAVNNDGSVKIGYTAPSAASQAEVIATALGVADVDPRTITAIEAHGTGTQLGDPIEIAALSQVFRESTDDKGFCAIGSVKSNFGHLESAAGVAGLIKVVLALKHRRLPPSLHFEEPNPQINFDASPFYVNTELRDWQSNGAPRRAGVSSFGIGGTNAHAVVEEAPETPPSEPGKPWQLLVWSARSEPALTALTADLTGYLKDHPETDLADVAFTLQVGRRTLPHRRVLVCRDPEDALSALDPLDPERVFGSFQPSRDRPVTFMFSGQGSQYPDMGRELYEREPVYREHVDACCRQLEPRLGFDLRQVLYPSAGATEQAAERLAQTAVTQPALFVTEYALGRLLMAWGIAPQAMIGHSIGEYVAACFAGVLALPDALALVAERGRLMNELPGGAMLSVPLPAADIEPLLGGDHALAAINGPSLCVVSGPHPAIDELAGRLAEREVDCRRLHTSHAFHSPMMEPILEPFTEVVARVELKPPKIPFISNVSGTWITPEQATDASYWAGHLRQAVRFADGVAELAKEPDRSLLEVGPGRSLTTLARRSLPPDAATVVRSTMRHPGDEGSDLAFLLEALGRLWLGGASADWRALDGAARRRRVALPTYPFEERRYWVEAQPSGGDLQELEIEVGAGEAEDAETDARGHLQTVYVAPRNDLEQIIADIWQKKLGLARVGIYDNFFELGGHSLLATQVQAEISRRYQIKIPLGKLFTRPVVAGLAAVVAELTGTAGEAGEAPAATEPAVAAEAPAVAAELPAVVAHPEERRQPFPLTDMQQAQWIGRNTAFNMGNVAAHVYFENDSDDLDLERLEQTLRQVIARHEMLRAIVLPDGTQQILEELPPYDIERLDLRGCDPQEAEKRLEALRRRMSHQVRPADKWPLFEVRASRLPDGRLRMHISLDLVICDIASLRILLAEWSQLYHHPERPLPELELSFRDYVLSEHKIRETDLYRQSLDYWRERIPSLPPAPLLPLARDPAEIDRPHFSRWSHRLDHDAWQRVKARAAQAGISASGVVLTAFAKLLSTWSRSPRFCINSTIINRLPMHPQVTELIGEFASFAPTEVNDTPGKSFLELAHELQARSWQDLENRYVSGVRILREIVRLEGRAEGATMPVVLTSTLIHGSAAEEEGLTDWLGEPAHAISQTPQVWLDHSVFEDRAGLLMSWHAADGLFPDGLLDDMWQAYVQLYSRLADDERTWQRSALDLVPAAQLATRRELNATEAPVGDELLHTLFAARAAARPEHPAVLAPDRRLSYGELERGANRLGRRLRALEVQPNELVPVVMEKGWEQIPAVLAVLKAGGAYLGIEADTPEERLRYMLENSGARMLLTQPALREAVDWPPGIEVLAVDDGVLAQGDGSPLASVQGPDDLAYVIYTSGSTGRPKGVMINHRGAVNTILDVNQRFSVGPADRVLALSSLAFDLSVWDVFGLLAAGGTIVLPRAGSQRDPGHWLELVVGEEVTVWNSVPALMEIFAEYSSRRPEVPPLRLALLSGDWIPVTLPGRIRKLVEGVEVISLGGATEASIWSILYPVGEVDPAWDSIPYGRPMANQRFHVLGEALQPCPVWVPGELYIGGIGLAQGYWRDEEKTRAAFFHHPDTGERLYRTGDLGRYLPDGNIEFLGREDFQVKVLGHRIELGEIEACLVQHPSVRVAAVQALGDQRGSKRLAAYVVPETVEPADGADEAGIDLAGLREFLGERLPDYMVPPDFVVLAELPLTANGKVDRRALPEPQRGGGESGEAALVEGPVAELVEIFSRVLGSERVGVHDNFFELGGDSILGIQLVNLANESGLHITPQQLFEHQTIAELAPVAAAAGQLAEQGLVTGPVPLTPFQRRFLSAHPESEGGSQWILLELAEGVDPVLLGRAVQQLISHHDALRLRVERGDGDWRQRNATDDQAVHLARVRWPAGQDRERALERLSSELESDLDLALGPLVAGAVIEPEDGGSRLFLLAVHRVAVDTRSWQLLLGDLEASYAQLSRGEALEMPQKTVSFKHWAHALEDHARSPELQREVDYWLDSTRTRAGHLELGGGADLGGPPLTVSVCLEAEDTRALFGDALEPYRLAPEELILTALVEAFTERVEAPLLIEFAQSGRSSELDGLDLSRTVGRFTVLYPVLLQIAGFRDPGERLKAVKEQVRGVPDHGLGHGVLRYLSPDPEVLDRLAGQLVPELRFSYLGHLDRLLPAGSRLGTLSDVRSLARDPLVGHGHLLSVCAYAVGDRVMLDWTFPERDGKRALVERLAAAFLDSAKALLAHCLSPEAGGFTPSDFPEADIDQSELDTFMSLFAGSDS